MWKLKNISCRMDLYSRASCVARRKNDRLAAENNNFYSRASCEARPLMLPYPSLLILFLLTRLLRGATHGKGRKDRLVPNFYSRASCEARLSAKAGNFAFDIISTHAPLARRDSLRHGNGSLLPHFYSRASCEARLSCSVIAFPTSRFLLTRLLRGATATYSMQCAAADQISLKADIFQKKRLALTLFSVIIILYFRRTFH